MSKAERGQDGHPASCLCSLIVGPRAARNMEMIVNGDDDDRVVAAWRRCDALRQFGRQSRINNELAAQKSCRIGVRHANRAAFLLLDLLAHRRKGVRDLLERLGLVLAYVFDCGARSAGKSSIALPLHREFLTLGDLPVVSAAATTTTRSPPPLGAPKWRQEQDNSVVQVQRHGRMLVVPPCGTKPLGPTVRKTAIGAMVASTHTVPQETPQRPPMIRTARTSNAASVDELTGLSR